MSSPVAAAPREIDLLRWPLIGAVLRWRHLRTAAQIILLIVALVIVAHGLFGPDLAPKNLAAVLTWIHYRGLLIGALLAVGNVFCGACPMILVRDVGRRLHAPSRRWPRWLGRKQVAIALFAGVLFAYELFDLWGLPAATAWLVIGYFAAALAVDLTFRGASFCKHVCPVGQFNFLFSTLSPFEVKASDARTCASCETADCIKGRREPAAPLVQRGIVQRGCELALFLPTKTGNLDCTFCLDCVRACPHDNVGITLRLPGEELADDRRRSSIGRLSRRADLAWLAVIFTFGGLLNAFAMTGPIHGMELSIARALHTTREAPVLSVIFLIALVGLPLLLCGGAAGATRALGGKRTLAGTPARGIRDIAVRYAYALVPFGAGVWAAHYAFHFLTAFATIVPVAQGAIADAIGIAIAGEPDWRWLGMRPGAVFPIQIGVILLGALGSLALVHAVSERDYPGRAPRAAASWALLVIALTAAALWILAQPMEMRGTTLVG